MAAIRRGAQLLQGSVVWGTGVGAPPRGEAFENELSIAGWPPFAAGRSSYKGSVGLRFGVGAPPRGEAFGLSSLLRDDRHSLRGATPTRAV